MGRNHFVQLSIYRLTLLRLEAEVWNGDGLLPRRSFFGHPFDLSRRSFAPPANSVLTRNAYQIAMCVEKTTPDKLYGGRLEAAFSGIGAEQVEAFDDVLESLSARMREGIRYLQIALEATELSRRRPHTHPSDEESHC